MLGIDYARIWILIIVSQFPVFTNAQYSQLNLITIDSSVSFRGMSVPNDSVIWISGSKGSVYKSVDGAKSFTSFNIKEEPDGDFRSVFAFNDSSAIVANTGSPANIYKTTDGGTNWVSVYENNHKDAFLDGIDFWNEKEGICYGDPINGKMMILRTEDGGNTWKELIGESRPLLVDDEASFAASGTAIRCLPNRKVIIVTGGALSRLLISLDNGTSWKSIVPPIIQGEASTGIFSFDFKNDLEGVIVGGDHKSDTMSTKHIYFTPDGGKTWHFPETPTRGYRECVQYLQGDSVIAVGPSGIDISHDGGRNWEPFSDEKKLHVLRKARSGKLVVVAGGEGKVGVVHILKGFIKK